MNQTQTKTNVGLYIRVSTSKQATEGFSLEGQKEEGIAFAKKEYGEDVNIQLFVDEGKSAKTTKSRKALNEMMDCVKNGKLQAVITYKVSRLSRNLSDSLKLVEEISNSNVIFH